MNINFDDAKEHFDKKGYCSFNIKDFDIEFYNIIDEFLKCDDEYDLKNIFYEFRFDSYEIETTYLSPNKDFLEAKRKEIEILNNCKDHSKISQLWYYQKNIDYIQNNLSTKYPDIKKIDLKKRIIKTTNNILKYFYDIDTPDELVHNELQFSLYDRGGIFIQHSDGVTINLCSIIIYLNKDYKKENGGLLTLNGEKIIPEMGVVALMDLSKNDIRHGVTKVINGNGRFAILNFPKLKDMI